MSGPVVIAPGAGDSDVGSSGKGELALLEAAWREAEEIAAIDGPTSL